MIWFAIKGVLVALLLPPTGFLTLAVVALLLCRAWPKAGRVVAGTSLLALLTLSMPVVSETMLVQLESGLPMVPPPDAQAGAIVVLGADVARSIGEPPPARVGPLSLERDRTAATLYRQTHLPILVSGGTIQADLPPVGEVMAENLREDFRVPVRWVEPHSRDTWENASDSAAILQREGIGTIYVVTHAWHMRRALIAFRHTGLRVIAAPTPLDRPVTPIFADFLPKVSSWMHAYFALHEWVGCAWYSIR